MKKYLNGPSIFLGLICFAVFMVAACAFYYLTAGVFVSAEVAALYAALAALGGLAVIFCRFLFAIFFYIGCLLGWLSGRYIGSLEGAFAPTAGLICTFFLISVFSLIGVYLEYHRIRRSIRKSRARREQEEQKSSAAAAAMNTEHLSHFHVSGQNDGGSTTVCSPPMESTQETTATDSAEVSQTGHKNGPQN
ncbi:MAG: hypothetical protein LKK00_06685 [Intestinimonas sp.]|nr:hypothetical protein [Intestinimonas sp.]